MLRRVYVRYKKNLPENEMFFAAQCGFEQRGVEVVPFLFHDLVLEKDKFKDLARWVQLA